MYTAIWSYGVHLKAEHKGKQYKWSVCILFVKHVHDGNNDNVDNNDKVDEDDKDETGEIYECPENNVSNLWNRENWRDRCKWQHW